MNSENVVVIGSGGLDSTTLIYYIIEIERLFPHVLSFNYGQKHSKELESIKTICQKLSLPHKVINIPDFSTLAYKSALTNREREVPKLDYSKETQAITVVPNRNATLLCFAVAYAYSIGSKKVYYGAHASDYAVYPDCRREFVEAFEQMVRLSLDQSDFRVIAPFVNKTKSQIVKLGLELKVPFELTWSCYEGLDRPCLTCGTCRERIIAFYANHFKDPLLTDEEWERALRVIRGG